MIKIMDHVSFRIGRGSAVGRIVNVDESSGKVAVRTEQGKILYRKIGEVELVPQGPDGETLVADAGGVLTAP